jgi:UPF0716 family protein affecting phage T7 exclusion
MTKVIAVLLWLFAVVGLFSTIGMVRIASVVGPSTTRSRMPRSLRFSSPC